MGKTRRRYFYDSTAFQVYWLEHTPIIMGIPAFYRWLVSKYPKIVTNTSNLSTPDGAVDNLYLDINGIIHNARPSSETPPNELEATIFQDVSKALDRLIALVNPRKLLYVSLLPPSC